MTKGDRICGLILASPFLIFFFIFVVVVASSDSNGKPSTIEMKETKDCTFHVKGQGWINDYCSNADKYLRK